MIIAISSTGHSLDSILDERFGRADYLLFFDESDRLIDTIQQGDAAPASGAGIALAQKLAEKKTDVLITGHVGPNAYQVLSEAGIDMVQGKTGTIRDQLAWYRDKKLEKITQAGRAHLGKV